MKSFNRHISSLILTSVLASSPMVSYADNFMLTIINHYDKPLTFTVGINPHILPDLYPQFNLAQNDQVTSRVLNINHEAYLGVKDNYNHNAFWGVDVENNQVKIHGYIGKGIAYSWKNSVVTFCTPEEYQKNKSC